MRADSRHSAEAFEIIRGLINEVRLVPEGNELRIVDDELWQQVKQRQQVTRNLIKGNREEVRSERARRPVYLLSGLLKCGCCSGGFSKISKDHYGCSNARNRGTCDNRLTIRRDVIEESVLGGLKEQLMAPELVKEFVAEYHREINRLTADRGRDRDQKEKEVVNLQREIRQIIDAIKSGMRSSSMAEELENLETRKNQLETELSSPPAPPIRLHPNLAELYRRKIADLKAALNEPGTREEAAALLRGLIEEIRLVPVDGELAIYLVGNLAEIMKISSKKHPSPSETEVQITLVAGARNHRELILRTVI